MIHQKYDGFYTGKLTCQNIRLLVACGQEWWCLLSGWNHLLNLFASQIQSTRQCHFGSSVFWNEQNIAQRIGWLACQNRCSAFERIWLIWPSLSVQQVRHAYIFLVRSFYFCNFPYSALQLHNIVLLAEFIKPADVTDIHPVNIWPRKNGDNFGVKLVRTFELKKVASGHFHQQLTLKPSFLLYKLTIGAKKILCHIHFNPTAPLFRPTQGAAVAVRTRIQELNTFTYDQFLLLKKKINENFDLLFYPFRRWTGGVWWWF